MESKIYTVTDIKDLLNISRTKAYEYVKKVYKEGKPFKVIKVGENYRVPKTIFDKWLNGEWLRNQIFAKIFVGFSILRYRMEEIIIESNNVFFVNNEWRYERRIVNLSTFTISYEVKKGLKTKEEAVQFKEIDDKQFQKDLKKNKKNSKCRIYV